MKCQEIAVNGTPDRKGKKYPVEVYPARVKGHGVIPIKIYFKYTGKGGYWLVEDRSRGKRRLLNCASHDAARERANQVAEAIAKGKQAMLRLNRQDLDSYEIAKEAVAPFNVGVHFACQEWAHAKTMLAGRGCVLDAIRFYLEHGGDALTPKSFDEAKEAFLQFKAQQGISKDQQRKIRSRLEKVAVRFGKRPLHSIIPGELEQFLAGFQLAPKTFNHYRKDLSALYNFARTNRFTPKDFNPAREFKAATEGFRHVEFFKPEQMKKLLAAAQTPADLLYLVLCGFAGLRPCETVRLRWEIIGEDFMRLPVGISGKKGRPRDVKIAENLKLWLAPYRKKSGRMLPEDFEIRTKPNELAKLAGIVWIPDGLRHAFGTFRYATVKNIDVVSDEMGNTREICKKHYINKLVTEQEANVWFAIKPDGGNIIPMQVGRGVNGEKQAEDVGPEQIPATGQP
jgi:integrase